MSKFITVFAVEGEGAAQVINTDNVIRVITGADDNCIVVFCDGNRITIDASIKDVIDHLQARDLM